MQRNHKAHTVAKTTVCMCVGIGCVFRLKKKKSMGVGVLAVRLQLEGPHDSAHPGADALCTGSCLLLYA